MEVLEFTIRKKRGEDVSNEIRNIIETKLNNDQTFIKLLEGGVQVQGISDEGKSYILLANDDGAIVVIRKDGENVLVSFIKTNIGISEIDSILRSKYGIYAFRGQTRPYERQIKNHILELLAEDDPGEEKENKETPNSLNASDKSDEKENKDKKPVEKAPQPVAQKPTPPEEEGKVKEIVDKDQLIEIITRKSTDIITPRDFKPECSAKFGDEDVSGLCISALYFRLRGTPMLFVPYYKKLYVIGNSDFGRKLTSKFDDLVEAVADSKRVPNIIGTKIVLMYVTQGTKDVPNGAIYAFVPFLPPNEYTKEEEYVYDLKTLPQRYYNTYEFVDIADVGDIHILFYEGYYSITWLILRGTYNIKKGDKVKVVSVNGMPQITKTG